MYDPGLIYDVGMHRGEDTEYYLKKGFRVIAFEANPQLVRRCKATFDHQIASGRLTIIEGAVAPKEHGDRITFYKSSNSVWGSIEPNWNKRNLTFGQTSEKLQVERVDFADVLHRYGVPFFLKVDIEGGDRHVLKALQQFRIRPKLISMESEKVEFLNLKSELKLLHDLDYDKFRAVQQKTVPGSSIITEDLCGARIEHTFAADASGPFGDDLPQAWLNYEEVIATYRQIFKCYRLFGDSSVLRRLKGDGVLYARRNGYLADLYRAGTILMPADDYSLLSSRLNPTCVRFN